MPKLIAAVIACLAVAATRAEAGPPFACCVCEAAESTLFCEAVASDDTPAFIIECSQRGGTAHECSAAADPADCAATFEDAECPSGSPSTAPLAGPGGLLALAAVLVGAATLRLRRAPARNR